MRLFLLWTRNEGSKGFKNRCCEIGCPTVLMGCNILIICKQTRTTWVVLGLSLGCPSDCPPFVGRIPLYSVTADYKSAVTGCKNTSRFCEIAFSPFGRRTRFAWNRNSVKFNFFIMRFPGFTVSLSTTFARIVHYLREDSALSSRRELTTFAKVVGRGTKEPGIICVVSIHANEPPAFCKYDDW